MKKKIILLALLLFLGSSSAHRAHMNVGIDELVVKSWFGGGDPIQEGKITVYIVDGDSEELYLEGETDENGDYSFPHKIGVKLYRVEVESVHLPGHGSELLINMSSLGAGEQENSSGIVEWQGVIAGLGYLLGLSGLAIMYSNRKSGRNT